MTPAPLFALMHSPSVGPATWRPVADVLASRHRSYHRCLADIVLGWAESR